jgi:hypothetical protein
MRKLAPCSMVLLGLAIGAMLFVSCSSDDDTGTIVQPIEIEGLLLQKIDDVPGYAAALNRLLLHFMGMPQLGVNLTTTSTGVTGTVGVDKDGDGIQEGTVSGTLTWNDPAQGIAGGATIELTELTGNLVSMTADVAATGPLELTFSNIVATVPAEGARPEVTVSAGQIVVDAGLSPPGLSGFVEFMVGDLAATMTLMNDGSGNPTAFVQGNGFSFTVP